MEASFLKKAMVLVIRISKCLTTTVHLKWDNFRIRKLYLNKAVKKISPSTCN